MAHGHVAYAMRTSFGTAHVTADHIAAWERGSALPDPHELAALAGALWCHPSEVMGHPRTLREHRIARGIPAEDVARATGLSLASYVHMEETGRWTGDHRQSAKLGSLLGLPPRDHIAITGLEDELARLLTEAVSTRWQAHARAIAKLISVDRKQLHGPLDSMYQEYQALMAATLSRASGSTASGEDGRRYVEEIVDHFWARLSE
ncbi:helix-turn-helix transcriptional regulator [Streptomyces poriferorum]|uniref:Helix-turn-helix transcriptional regulator n=1 Tax=Streptomyces poriferorum TaxID=2798799 RepID=A0ABY9IT53_9ACTN|nr:MULTISPECIES: helix-turn-helix transcriptional regulator [unclassified Streptomyces]MDP5312443.1 helix-turn-helix transcriptional regulator [Streptomyces sp. Alt4]WLQ48802.1 helix-turn-helix transcriptional regulator [Streptomyces sp. Alt1]WLQ58521.1 helix-turn-helix transcriptional regulator [Streptomyces sp. Alt2]WSQ45975.1 helix-turn-helix transcriptional regulator [Streptomyces sp. NBC_01220]